METVVNLAEDDEKVLVILGDISHYLFNNFQTKFPDRFYNMGICENALVSVAAGLSSQGFFPFVHTIAPFLTERCVEQIKLDMSYNQFGGNLVTCGASFDYAWDGPTHHCYTDLAILRLIPDMEVIQPGSNKEANILLKSQYNNGKTTYFRLSDNPHEIDISVEFGKGTILKRGKSNVTVMTAGPILDNVLTACKDLDVNLVYFNTIKPIDMDLIIEFKDTKILVVQDAHGLFEAICEIENLSVSKIGLPDKFCTYYGTVNDIRREIGIDSASIQDFVHNSISS